MLGERRTLEMRKSAVIIEDFINSLEKLIDDLDDEWHHNDEGEWRMADNIRNNIIPASKEKFKKHLDEYIDRRIETYCDRHKIQRVKVQDFEEQ
jgi:glycosylphosphatidylinositol transamidase (GPIT) subunit GPI8